MLEARIRDELEEERLEETFVMCGEWETTDYRGGHDTGRIRSGEAEVEVWICHQPICHPGRSGHWIGREGLLGLSVRKKSIFLQFLSLFDKLLDYQMLMNYK